MRVESVTHRMNEQGIADVEELQLRPVYSDDKSSVNYQWSQWTPSGLLTLQITNPAAIGKVKRGQDFYVDLIPCVE